MVLCRRIAYLRWQIAAFLLAICSPVVLGEEGMTIALSFYLAKFGQEFRLHVAVVPSYLVSSYESVQFT